MNAESDSENIAVRFSKSRSPKHHSTQDFDGLTGDVFMPLVAGDEFEEEEGKLWQLFGSFSFSNTSTVKLFRWRTQISRMWQFFLNNEFFWQQNVGKKGLPSFGQSLGYVAIASNCKINSNFKSSWNMWLVRVKSTCCFACCTNNYESLLSIAYAIFGELGCLFDKTRDYLCI